MAMTPAEPSRPGRKWSARGAATWAQDPFWSVVAILFFVLGLYLTASGALLVTRHASSLGLLIPLIQCGAGVAIVSGMLYVYGAHPRTNPTSASFAMMKALMVLAGIALFCGGAFGVIETTDFSEQLALALVSLFFLAVPLSLHLIRR